MSAHSVPGPLDEERIRGEVVVERELTQTHRILRFTVPRQHAPPAERGWRLDRYLHALLPTISRTLIQRWVDGGAALVDGEAVASQHKVRAGNRIELRAPLPSRDADAPAPSPLVVLYRDRWLLVVSKPAGQLAHQAGRTMSGTLINQLQDLLAVEGIDPTSARLVNRIDRDTSGIVLVSLESEAHTRLARSMEARSLRKEYRAIVHGVPVPDSGSWLDPIGPGDGSSIARVVRVDGQACHTDYTVFERTPSGSHALLGLRLHTGRQHQIRVHAAHHGHPLVGDWVYGRGCRELPGQALHSAVLGLDHPMTGQPLLIEAPLPLELTRLWMHLCAGGQLQPQDLSEEQRSKLGVDEEDPGVRRPSWLSDADFEALRSEAGEDETG